MAVEPKIKSFLIADMVFQEKLTNKWNIIGIFDKFYAYNFPAMLTGVDLYIRLTDAEGDYNIRVEFCDESDRKLAVFERIKLKVKSRLQYPEFGVKTKNLPIQKPGKYFFYIYMNEKQVGSMPLLAVKINK